MRGLGERAAAAACGLLLTAGTIHANGLQVTNVVVSKRDNLTATVTFDIAWQNAWRYTNVNHDAAWVFFKARQEGGTEWKHVRLAGTGPNPAGYSAGAGTAIDLTVPPDGAGLFVRRAAQGSGTLAATGVQAVWDLSSTPIVKTSRAQLQALAIEMAYVAEGAFEVGSGGTESGSLTDGSWTSGGTIPFRIAGEGALAIAKTAGALWGTSTSGRNTIGGAGTLPAAFPKGYAPFYCMKHEITQGQYADFLNTLTAAQATARYYKTTSYRFTIRLTNGVYLATAPDRECNYVSYADAAAFMDWAGLRPMTELEFEKACRGPMDPVANEYAWGTTAISATTTIAGDGTGADTAADGNCNYAPSLPDGPYRAGIYATSASSREAAGASFWGILELSGSMWEGVVALGNATGRAFTGIHGDGKLDAAGNANVPAWPGTDAVGIGFRGGSCNDTANLVRVSDRDYCGNHTDANREFCVGFHAVRTAPDGVRP